MDLCVVKFNDTCKDESLRICLSNFCITSTMKTSKTLKFCGLLIALTIESIFSENVQCEVSTFQAHEDAICRAGSNPKNMYTL